MSTVTLRNEETIYNVVDLKTRLSDALASGERVTIDDAALERADITCLQLLLAAARAAGDNGLVTIGPPGRTLAALLTAAGLGPAVLGQVR